MPNRATALTWERSPERDRLVGAALALADGEGLEAVSIRRVAAALEMRPMSIYTHVASKDDLVALMFDAVSAEMLVPAGELPGAADWRGAFAAIAERAYATYLAHPWMLAAFERRPLAGPSQMARGEQAAGALAESAIAPEHRWIAVSILYEWTIGHALHAITLRDDRRLAGQLESTDPAEHPALAAALGQVAADRFQPALDAVLDGIERRFAGAE